jgi:hypothetical protein
MLLRIWAAMGLTRGGRKYSKSEGDEPNNYALEKLPFWKELQKKPHKPEQLKYQRFIQVNPVSGFHPIQTNSGKICISKEKIFRNQSTCPPPLSLTGQTRHRQGGVSKITEMRHRQGGGVNDKPSFLMQNVSI